MFEKFSNLDVDSSGYGGEYTVQAGFGWTNGVLLWVAANYGHLLVAPECPPLVVADTSSTGSNSPSGALPIVGQSVPATVAIAVLTSLVVSALISWV